MTAGDLSAILAAMRIWQGTVVLLTSVFVFACGGTKPGDSCNTTGYLCDSETTALECRLGKWTELPCRGPEGCKDSGGKVDCDMSLNQAGDACGASTEGKGFCEQGGTGTLECRQGTLVKTNTCTSCTTSQEEVVCFQ